MVPRLTLGKRGTSCLNKFCSIFCLYFLHWIRTSTDFAYSEYRWFGAEGSASISPATLHREAEVSWRHYYALDPLSKNVIDMFKLLTCLISELTSQCAQHCLCWFQWGVFWHCHRRPGTVTGFRTKRQDNRPQYLIHVHLTDQVSLYNHKICRPRF